MNPNSSDGSKRFPIDGDLGHHEPEAHPDYAELVAFFGHLAWKVEPLRPVLAQHLADAEGEMLPSLLMSDVTTWLLAEVNKGHTMALNTTLETLEEGYRVGSRDLQSVMVLSFMEQLPGFANQTADPHSVGAMVRGKLGPTLTQALRTVEEWRQ